MRALTALAALCLALAATPLAASDASDLWQQALAERPPLASVATRGRIAPLGEPGTPLRIRGTMYAPDGRTPLAGVLVFAYQTDASGVYAREPQSRSRFRLSGWARTDAQGEFVFDTIHPGPYPGRQIPAHVHFMAEGGGYPAQWLPELRFAGDPALTAAALEEDRRLGTFASIVRVDRGADGGESCNVRFRLRAESNF